MDNVTHSLVGLMLARVGTAGNTGRAAVMMVIAANIPDIDIVSGLGGSLTYLEYHRGYAHALLSAPVMALIPMLLVWRLSWRAYAACVIGVLSHLLLDWTNVYGIRMLLPFSARWLRLDITDIVDPWILAVLLLAVAAPALAGLVSAEIGAKPGGAKRGWAWFALLALLAYEGGRVTVHERALGVMAARIYNGVIPSRLTALPSRWNPLHWRGVAEGEGFAALVPIDLAGEFDPSAGRIEYAAQPGPAIEAARRTREFEVFGRFNQLPFWKVTPLVDGSAQVELIDLRFGTPEQPGFAATALVDAAGRVSESRFGFGVPR